MSCWSYAVIVPADSMPADLIPGGILIIERTSPLSKPHPFRSYRADVTASCRRTFYHLTKLNLLPVPDSNFTKFISFDVRRFKLGLIIVYIYCVHSLVNATVRLIG